MFLLFTINQWFLVAISLVIPLIVLPFLMRFVVSRIVLLIVKKKHLSAYLKANQEGWEDETDREVSRLVSAYTLDKLKSLSVMKYRLREDVEQMLLLIQSIYHPDRRGEEFSYRFSVTKLLECFLLAFGDLYREYASSVWFKTVRNMRLLWLTRMRSWFDFYGHVIGRVPFLQKILASRILGPLFRVLLIPLLGLPSLIWYSLRSVLTGIFYEGYLRFLYGFVLLKIGYYAPYLYGRRNTIIRRRIKEISKERLAIINMRVEERLTLSPGEGASPYFKEAAELYFRFLRELGLGEDSEIELGDGSTKGKKGRPPEKPHSEQTGGIFEQSGRFLAKIWGTSKQAYRTQNPLSRHALTDLKEIYRLFQEIGRVYYPGAEQPLLKLRIHEALELGYMGSVLILHRIFSTPGVRVLLDRVSVEFVLQVKRFAEGDFARYGSAYLNVSYKSLRLVHRARKIFRVLRGTLFPTALVTILGSPILFQQLKILLREFVYHRAGRLFLYTWEANALRKRSPLDLLLW